MNAAATVLTLSAGACLASGDEYTDVADDELSAERQSYVDSINGLKSVNGLKSSNGLKSFNGLKSVNGLSTTNGLKSINGLKSMNGLMSRNGLKSMNGLTVDCLGKVLGSSCTGSPDGLLSNTTGMMASNDGIMTASYLVRCALAADTKIRLKDYTGALVTLSGELGLTPEWKDGQCTAVCEEKISACLMSLTNGEGEHINLELSGPFEPLGTDTSKAFPYQEAAFFGNLFLDKAEAYYCIGEDYAVVEHKSIEHLAVRACQGYTDKGDGCPYTQVGLCNSAVSSTYEGLHMDYMCFDTGDTLRKCRDTDGDSRKWLYPITTHRDVR
jgi:hypothetical protein